jgi:antirestriction protein ArdC
MTRIKAPTRRGRQDVASTITQRIVDELEKGVMPWRCRWRKSGGSLPRRHSGEPYRGINVLLLGLTAHASGYSSPYWMTFRQARDYGGQVRKGERSTLVVYYGSAQSRQAPKEEADDEAEPGTYRFLKGYAAFNVDQIENLPDRFTPTDPDLDAGGRPIERLQNFFDRMDVPVHIGGDVAAYRPAQDDIIMPSHQRFNDSELWYASLAHEIAHYAGAEHRLNREVAKRYHENQACRAEEELIAELAAAMMGAHLGFTNDHIDDHACYVGSWLKALRSNQRLIFKAAAEAQRAVDWMFDAAGIAEKPTATRSAA